MATEAQSHRGNRRGRPAEQAEYSGAQTCKRTNYGIARFVRLQVCTPVSPLRGAASIGARRHLCASVTLWQSLLIEKTLSAVTDGTPTTPRSAAPRRS